MYNVWGDIVDEELETLSCTWRDYGDLFDSLFMDCGVE